MVWRVRSNGCGPPVYDRCLPHFTIKLHYSGTIKGTEYVGGSFGFVDYCDEDEISIIELCYMIKEMGQSSGNDFYLMVNGKMTVIKNDAHALTLFQLVRWNRLVNVYAVCKLVDVVPTQCSQNVADTVMKNKSKEKKKTNTNSKRKRKRKGKEVVKIREDIHESDTEDYDPDSTSSDSDYEVFNESDDGVNADDSLFDSNVDKYIEYGGLGSISVSNDSEYALVRNEVELSDLANLDGESDDSDVLDIGNSSSNTDDDVATKIRKKNKPTIFNEKTYMSNPIFSVGMEFKTHAIFRDAVKQHSIKLGKKVKFKKSDRKKVQAVYEGSAVCPWFIYGAFVKGDGVFRVKRYISEHLCTRSYNVPWVSTNWIVRTYGSRIEKNPTWPIESLAATIESEWTVHVDRQKVFKAKRKCLAQLEGTATEQFGQLYGYIEEVRNTNPGTTIILKCKPILGSENEMKFKRLYICWGSLKKGFIEGCRPLIGLDGCHLKSPHGGILLTTVGMDANNCIYPFAYAVVEKEKKKTWLWFLELLKDDLNVQNSAFYTFMTDKQKGLIDAIGELFPNAGHRFCVRHLYNNFKGDFKGLVLKEILWKAARASTVPEFTRAMEEMNKANPKAYQWLNARPPINWSRSHFDSFPKCDILLNNLSESFNSAILPARDKPIISMLEGIRTILVESAKKRRDTMMRWQEQICPKIKKRIDKLREEKGWIPRYFGNDQFQVEGPNDQFRVDLKKKTCGCRKWELSGIPCVHACAAYSKMDLEPMDYVHDCYRVSTYLEIYQNVLGSINGKNMWPSSGNAILLPPDVKKRAGRPKKVRRREPEEDAPTETTTLSRKGMKMTCSLCKKTGHNKRGCKNPTNGASDPTNDAETIPQSGLAVDIAGGTTSGLVPKSTNALNIPISSGVTSVGTGLVDSGSQGALNDQVGSSVSTIMAAGSNASRFGSSMGALEK